MIINHSSLASNSNNGMFGNSTCPYCSQYKLDSDVEEVPRAARQLYEMYGTEDMNLLKTTLIEKTNKFDQNHQLHVSKSGVDLSVDDCQTNSESIKQQHVDKIVIKLLDMVTEPTHAGIPVTYHSRLEHALNNIGNSFIGFGNNENNALGFSTNDWLSFIHPTLSREIAESKNLNKKNSFGFFESEMNEDDEEDEDLERMKLTPKIYSTCQPGLSEVDFLATGHEFTFFVYKCGCIGMCGTWSDSSASLFRFTWVKQLSSIHPSMFMTFFVSSMLFYLIDNVLYHYVISEDRKEVYGFGFNSQGQSSTRIGDAYVWPKKVDPALYHHEEVKFVKFSREGSYIVTRSNKL